MSLWLRLPAQKSRWYGPKSPRVSDVMLPYPSYSAQGTPLRDIHPAPFRSSKRRRNDQLHTVHLSQLELESLGSVTFEGV